MIHQFVSDKSNVITELNNFAITFLRFILDIETWFGFSFIVDWPQKRVFLLIFIQSSSQKQSWLSLYFNSFDSVQISHIFILSNIFTDIVMFDKILFDKFIDSRKEVSSRLNLSWGWSIAAGHEHRVRLEWPQGLGVPEIRSGRTCPPHLK